MYSFVKIFGYLETICQYSQEYIEIINFANQIHKNVDGFLLAALLNIRYKGNAHKGMKGNSVRVCLLASGSRGNSTLIEADNCRILIDAGLSGIETERRLATLGLSGEDLDAIFVTHEHHDHVGGIGPLSRRFDLPVHIDRQTHAALPKLGKIDRLHYFTAGETFLCRDIPVTPFSTTHDAVNPVGFTIETSEGKVGFATDLGIPTRLVAEQLKACRVLILEANHDVELLLNGPYPWELKQRIRSRHGHLSNDDSCRLLEDISWTGLEAVFLAHLSEENNCPEIVEKQFRQLLSHCNCTAQLIIGRQSRVSSCYRSGHDLEQNT